MITSKGGMLVSHAFHAKNHATRGSLSMTNVNITQLSEKI